MGFLGVLLEALGIFWGVEFCPLSLEIREGGGVVTRNLSSMHSICTSPILILLVRLPPPDKILHKYCHQFLWRWLQYTQDEGKAKAL